MTNLLANQWNDESCPNVCGRIVIISLKSIGADKRTNYGGSNTSAVPAADPLMTKKLKSMGQGVWR